MKESRYFDIYSSIKKKITDGEYKKGEKLLSKRNMADIEGVSVITVERAYGMLAE